MEFEFFLNIEFCRMTEPCECRICVWDGNTNKTPSALLGTQIIMNSINESNKQSNLIGINL